MKKEIQMQFPKSYIYDGKERTYRVALYMELTDSEPLVVIYDHIFGETESSTLRFGETACTMSVTFGDDESSSDLIECSDMDYTALVRDPSGTLLKDLFYGMDEDLRKEWDSYLQDRVHGTLVRSYLYMEFHDTLLDPDDILRILFPWNTYEAISAAARAAENTSQVIPKLRSVEGLEIFDQESIMNLAYFLISCCYTPDGIWIRLRYENDGCGMELSWD